MNTISQKPTTAPTPAPTATPVPVASVQQSLTLNMITVSVLALIFLLINYKQNFIPLLNNNLIIWISVILIFLFYIIYNMNNEQNVSLTNIKDELKNNINELSKSDIDIKNTLIPNLQKLLSGLIDSNKKIVDEAIAQIKTTNTTQDTLINDIKKIVESNNIALVKQITDLTTSTTNSFNEVKNTNLTQDNSISQIKTLVDTNNNNFVKQISDLTTSTTNNFNDVKNTLLPNLKTLLSGLIDSNKKIVDEAITQIKNINITQDTTITDIKNNIIPGLKMIVETNNTNLINQIGSLVSINDFKKLNSTLTDMINNNQKLLNNSINEITKVNTNQESVINNINSLISKIQDIDNLQDASIKEIRTNISNLNDKVSTKMINIQDWNIFTDENKNLCINNGSDQNICIDMSNNLVSIDNNFISIYKHLEEIKDNVRNNRPLLTDALRQKIVNEVNKTINCKNELVATTQKSIFIMNKVIKSNKTYKYKIILIFLLNLLVRDTSISLKLINDEIYVRTNPGEEDLDFVLLFNDDYIPRKTGDSYDISLDDHSKGFYNFILTVNDFTNFPSIYNKNITKYISTNIRPPPSLAKFLEIFKRFSDALSKTDVCYDYYFQDVLDIIKNNVRNNNTILLDDASKQKIVNEINKISSCSSRGRDNYTISNIIEKPSPETELKVFYLMNIIAKSNNTYKYKSNLIFLYLLIILGTVQFVQFSLKLINDEFFMNVRAINLPTTLLFNDDYISPPILEKGTELTTYIDVPFDDYVKAYYNMGLNIANAQNTTNIIVKNFYKLKNILFPGTMNELITVFSKIPDKLSTISICPPLPTTLPPTTLPPTRTLPPTTLPPTQTPVVSKAIAEKGVQQSIQGFTLDNDGNCYSVASNVDKKCPTGFNNLNGDCVIVNQTSQYIYKDAAGVGFCATGWEKNLNPFTWNAHPCIKCPEGSLPTLAAAGSNDKCKTNGCPPDYEVSGDGRCVQCPAGSSFNWLEPSTSAKKCFFKGPNCQVNMTSGAVGANITPGLAVVNMTSKGVNMTSGSNITPGLAVVNMTSGQQGSVVNLTSDKLDAAIKGSIQGFTLDNDGNCYSVASNVDKKCPTGFNILNGDCVTVNQTSQYIKKDFFGIGSCATGWEKNLNPLTWNAHPCIKCPEGSLPTLAAAGSNDKCKTNGCPPDYEVSGDGRCVQCPAGSSFNWLEPSTSAKKCFFKGPNCQK